MAMRTDPFGQWVRFPLSIQYHIMEPKTPDSDLVDPNKEQKKISKERRKYVKEHTLGADEGNKKQ